MPNLPLNRVAILTSHLSTGDAVSNDAVGMCAAFQRRGLDARLFAGSWDPSEAEVFKADGVKEFVTGPEDLLIYHFSIEWEPGLTLLRELRCRRAIKYHNVTPPGFFEGISLWHEEKCRVGREQLTEIARMNCDLYTADSEYNRLDLLNAGAAGERCFVVPPFHHVDRLRTIEADIDVLDEYRDGKTNILMVGRVAPNKGHAALIEAFSVYYHDYNRDSRLLIVGKEEAAFRTYSERLHEWTATMLSEEAVLFTGEATDRELKSYYLMANVFAMASEHEGFCVPIIEAMSMKVPVVAYASSAIPATVGGAGLVLEERNPYLMAETIDRLAGDENLNVAFGMAGWQRYERHFANEQVEAELFEAIGHLE
ncbi:MAG TPA: glycosyltransferase family 4 protein [Pyrinomonadaceae bacterium]|nr:glycosyltransferase family 4 protein [Pyrinomonadaceae bacterium]